jgi:hypothetical protein
MCTVSSLNSCYNLHNSITVSSVFLFTYFNFTSTYCPLAQGGHRRSKLRCQATVTLSDGMHAMRKYFTTILQAYRTGFPGQRLQKLPTQCTASSSTYPHLLHVLPFSVGLPVVDRLLLLLAAHVVDLHEFFLVPCCLLSVILCQVFPGEVLPDVHPLLPSRLRAVLWSELLW